MAKKKDKMRRYESNLILKGLRLFLILSFYLLLGLIGAY
jgi:hypothetical protein